MYMPFLYFYLKEKIKGHPPDTANGIVLIYCCTIKVNSIIFIANQSEEIKLIFPEDWDIGRAKSYQFTQRLPASGFNPQHHESNVKLDNCYLPYSLIHASDIPSEFIQIPQCISLEMPVSTPFIIEKTSSWLCFPRRPNK